MSIIIPANSASAAGGFQVANSVRFNGNNNDHLKRTFGTPTNAQKYTMSWWFKGTGIATGSMFEAASGNAQNGAFVYLKTDDLQINSIVGNSEVMKLIPNAHYQDYCAWYHLCFAVDVTLGTAADRNKLYINGERVTSFVTQTNAPQNTNGMFNTAIEHLIGIDVYNSGGSLATPFNGYISEFVFIDGSQEEVTAFGEFEEDSGIWRPIDPSGLTFGDNGFYLDFQDSSNLGNDVSGENNDFTVVNLTAISQSTDTCTNNFSTLNKNDVMRSGTSSVFTPIFSEGNLKMSDTATNNYSAFGSIAVETGKWYWEMKIPNYDPNLGNRIGLFYGNNKAHSGSYYNGSNGFLIHQNGSIYTSGASTAYMATFSDNIIITFALDRTNGLSYVGAGGSWADGNGNTNQSFANAVAVQTKLSITMINDITFPFFDVYGNTSQLMNFGSPSFAISSGNADGNGYGNFEYTVPDGYYALNTKNLAEFG